MESKKIDDEYVKTIDNVITITFVPVMYKCGFCADEKNGIFRSLSNDRHKRKIDDNITYTAYFDKPFGYRYAWWLKDFRFLCEKCNKQFRNDCNVEKERLLGKCWQKILCGLFGKNTMKEYKIACQARDNVIEKWLLSLKKDM